MSATLLLVPAAVAALVRLVCRRVVTGRRASPVPDTAVHPLYTLTSPVRRPLPDAGLRPAVVDGWRTVAVGSPAEAEDLTDWLSLAGAAEREVVAVGGACLLVRWR